MKILLTGAAGFIGANLVLSLLENESDVDIVGIDSMNDYYDVSIKEFRLRRIEAKVRETDGRWNFIKGNIADKTLVNRVFQEFKPDMAVNLAAQAGVRYSIANPDAYIESNIIGFYNILEACRHSYDGGKPGVKHLVYASSSSVYGLNSEIPYSVDDRTDTPVSLYAATKKSNELMAHAYSKLYDIPSTGLRFFTVYGPAGRPDMAYFGFTEKLLTGQKIKIFNYGNCRRDFTYIRAEVLPADYDFDAHKELVPMQPGDVPVTYADTSALERDFHFTPRTDLRMGLRRFAEWYRNFYICKMPLDTNAGKIY